MKTKFVFLMCLLTPLFALSQGMIIGENTYVTVSNGVKLRVLNADLKILANGDGMGSLLVDDDANNTISVSGTGAETIVQSYIVADNWHYVSSPLSDAVSGTFFEMWLKPFVESDHGWGEYILPTNVELEVGKGYAVYSYSSGTPSPGTKSVEYSSTTTEALNSGTVSPTVGFTSSSHGNNLVGNPFISAIDWDASSGWTRTNIGNTIYIWTGSQYGTYTLNGGGTGTNGVTNIIAPGQGFFALTTATSPAISMNNNVRVHAGTGETIFKSDWPWFKLAVEETSDQWTDEVLLSFRPDGAPVFNEYDAKKWFSTKEEVPDLYVEKDGKNLASGAYGYFDDDLLMPLNFRIGTVGNSFRLYLSEIDLTPEIANIYLKDKVTGIVMDLLVTNEYLFTAQDGDDPSRFEVFFKEAYGIDEMSTSDLQVYYAMGKVIIFSSEKSLKHGTINVYNVIGQPVLSHDVSFATKRISFEVNIKPGAYMVEFINNNQRSTGKVLIN